MRIGVDFDNTIVSYDRLFHKVAVEGGHVPPETGASKLAVRDLLRTQGREQQWTEMQGYVYGARMMEAEPFPGVVDVIARLKAASIDVEIVSHKTRYPIVGPAYDLHEAARAWIDKNLVRDGVPLIPMTRVFFELTKDEKVARIASSQFTLFIDDLPEILVHPGFPKQTLPVLFNPTKNEIVPQRAKLATSWPALENMLKELQCITR